MCLTLKRSIRPIVVAIYERLLRTGLTGGPGMLGRRGAIGLISVQRVDLHNVYNGFEVILLTLDFMYETDARFETASERE